MMENICDMNLYDFLGVTHSASEQEIKKAYRKKALKCHPDKNPDNPDAAKLFLQLSKALEILLDESAKSAYDKVLNGKIAAKLRHQELDARRKKLKEDLEEKEKIAQEAARKYKHFDSRNSEDKLAAEIQRLRKEGSKQVEEEISYVKKQILIEQQKHNQTNTSKDSSQFRIKLKWHSEILDEKNGGYNVTNLTNMFSKYGEINGLIISKKKKGSALIEFENSQAAVNAYQLEKGLPDNPLKSLWLSGEPPTFPKRSIFDLYSGPRVGTHEQKESQKSRLFPSFNNSHCSNNSASPATKCQNDEGACENDFEAQVLQKLREAERKKRESQNI